MSNGPVSRRKLVLFKALIPRCEIQIRLFAEPELLVDAEIENEIAIAAADVAAGVTVGVSNVGRDLDRIRISIG